MRYMTIDHDTLLLGGDWKVSAYPDPNTEMQLKSPELGWNLTDGSASVEKVTITRGDVVHEYNSETYAKVRVKSIPMYSLISVYWVDIEEEEVE